MRRTVVSLAVVAAVVAAGCGDGTGPAPEPSPTPSSQSETTSEATSGAAQPSPSAPASAGSWDELRGRLEALDADVGMLAARVGPDGTCAPVAELDPGATRPLASIFKLYVLGAVAAAADAG